MLYEQQRKNVARQSQLCLYIFFYLALVDCLNVERIAIVTVRLGRFQRKVLLLNSALHKVGNITGNVRGAFKL